MRGSKNRYDFFKIESSMIQQNSIFKTFPFWYVLIGVLMILSMFLPFRINVETEGSSIGLFGITSYHKVTREVISGFKFSLPFISISIYFLTAVFISFSNSKITKILSLVFSFLLILSLIFLLFASTFSLSFNR